MIIENVDTNELGALLAQLVREGLTFRVTKGLYGWRIELTGGF